MGSGRRARANGDGAPGKRSPAGTKNRSAGGEDPFSLRGERIPGRRRLRTVGIRPDTFRTGLTGRDGILRSRARQSAVLHLSRGLSLPGLPVRSGGTWDGTGSYGVDKARLGAAGTPFLPPRQRTWAGAPPAAVAGPTLRLGPMGLTMGHLHKTEVVPPQIAGAKGLTDMAEVGRDRTVE